MNKQTLGLILGLGAAPICANAQTADEIDSATRKSDEINESNELNELNRQVSTLEENYILLDTRLDSGLNELNAKRQKHDDELSRRINSNAGDTGVNRQKLAEVARVASINGEDLATNYNWNLQNFNLLKKNFGQLELKLKDDYQELKDDYQDLKLYLDDTFTFATVISDDVARLDEEVKLNVKYAKQNAERISALESEKNVALYLGPVLGGDRTAIAAGVSYLPNSWLRPFAEGYFRTGSDIVDEKPLIEVRDFDGLQERSYHTKSAAVIPRAMAGVEGNVVVPVGEGNISLGGMIGGELDSIKTCTSGYDQLTFNGEAVEEKDSYASCSDPGFDVSFVLGTQGRYIHPISDNVNAGVVLRAQKNLESLNSGKGYRGFVLGEVQF